MAFELPDLPYPHDALASAGMSAETLEYHHDLHHNAYVTNGNKAIEGTEWAGKSLEDIITGTYDAKSVAQNGIFNNISQLWNHNQFWEMMAPGGSSMPSWCWLVQKADGTLAVTKTENGVNPLCFGQTALLGCDVWEHSYYIDFRNKRPAYLTNFLDNLVSWENVASRMAQS